MHFQQSDYRNPFSRRQFIQTVGASVTGLSLAGQKVLGNEIIQEGINPQKSMTKVYGAFLYPPTERLRKEGYYSWPGSSFNAEGRQGEYVKRIKEMERELHISIPMHNNLLDEEASVTRFIQEVKHANPDGLLLILFKKSHYEHVLRILDEVHIPTIVFATLGILLSSQINRFYRRPGVYLINSLDNLDAVAHGLKMMKCAHLMKEAHIGNICSSTVMERTVPHLGTKVQTIPHERFYDEFAQLETDDAVLALAKEYQKNAIQILQPTEMDIIDAAKTYYVLKRIIATEHTDALMMDCLPGLRKPHKHCPPCMGFMSLRDEGYPIGCQSDLNATLTLMLVQYLFNKPGFQQNPSMSTEKNLYFGAHCTSPSKIKGSDSASQPYILMSHAEAGWGCVPRVLWPVDEEVTMAQYVSGDAPHMHIYSGNVISCPSLPRTGGCRTNLLMSINEVENVCDVKGNHQIIFIGNHSKQLRDFCQLYNINVVT